MNANELRLGNYVSDKINRCVSIQEIRQEHYVFTLANESKIKYNINSAKPIPLTEEWLLMFGFIKKDEITFSLDLGGYYGYSRELEFFYEPNEKVCITLREFETNYKEQSQSIFLNNINYVHQLQNLYFALTQEELI